MINKFIGSLGPVKHSAGSIMFAGAILFLGILGEYGSFEGTQTCALRLFGTSVTPDPPVKILWRFNADTVPPPERAMVQSTITEPYFQRAALRKPSAEFLYFPSSTRILSSLKNRWLSDCAFIAVDSKHEGAPRGVIHTPGTTVERMASNAEGHPNVFNEHGGDPAAPISIGDLATPTCAALTLGKGEASGLAQSISLGSPLDSGEHTAMLIHDPETPRTLRGYVHIPAGVFGAQLKPDIMSSGYALESLRQAMLDYTGMVIKIDRFANINSSDFSKYPFLYITADDLFELTDREIINLREYFKNGGFALFEPYGAWIDSCRTPKSFGPVREMIREIFGPNSIWGYVYIPSEIRGAQRGVPNVFNEYIGVPIKPYIISSSRELESLRETTSGYTGIPTRALRPIPGNHEIYHCIFDTDISDGSTVPFIDPMRPQRQPWTCLEGVFLDGRLVLVYSEKRYGEQWRTMDRILPGMNILAYALLSSFCGGMP
jgi:hypothetical protein